MTVRKVVASPNKEDPMPKARRKRMTYTEGQRKTILLAAQKEGLTALQVQKKFGVKPITYYSWRKKRGVSARRGGRRALAMLAGSGDIGIQVRSAVQSRIRQVLPEIVKSEVGSYMNSLFGNGRRRRVKF
jgi:transposase-like protein